MYQKPSTNIKHCVKSHLNLYVSYPTCLKTCQHRTNWILLYQVTFHLTRLQQFITWFMSPYLLLLVLTFSGSLQLFLLGPQIFVSMPSSFWSVEYQGLASACGFYHAGYRMDHEICSSSSWPVTEDIAFIHTSYFNGQNTKIEALGLLSPLSTF